MHLVSPIVDESDCSVEVLYWNAAAMEARTKMGLRYQDFVRGENGEFRFMTHSGNGLYTEKGDISTRDARQTMVRPMSGREELAVAIAMFYGAVATDVLWAMEGARGWRRPKTFLSPTGLAAPGLHPNNC